MSATSWSLRIKVAPQPGLPRAHHSPSGERSAALDINSITKPMAYRTGSDFDLLRKQCEQRGIDVKVLAPRFHFLK